LVVGFLNGMGNGMGNGSIAYAFKQYLGMSTKQIKKLRVLSDDSRWVAVIKGAPQVICTQYNAYANYASNEDND
jgi:hypothetical protein